MSTVKNEETVTYIVITDYDVERFAKNVEDRLAMGFELVGGVSTAFTTNSMLHYSQALTRIK